MDIYLHFGTCIVGLNNIGLNNIGPNIIGPNNVCMYVCMFSTADLEIKNVPNPLRRYSPNNVDLDTDNFVDFDDFVAFIRNCQKMSENCPNVSKSVRT